MMVFERVEFIGLGFSNNGFYLFDAYSKELEAYDLGEGPEPELQDMFPVLFESPRIDAPSAVIKSMGESFCRAVGVTPFEVWEEHQDEQPAQVLPRIKRTSGGY